MAIVSESDRQLCGLIAVGSWCQLGEGLLEDGFWEAVFGDGGEGVPVEVVLAADVASAGRGTGVAAVADGLLDCGEQQALGSECPVDVVRGGAGLAQAVLARLDVLTGWGVAVEGRVGAGVGQFGAVASRHPVDARLAGPQEGDDQNVDFFGQRAERRGRRARSSV